MIFDHKYFAQELPSQLPDRELVNEQAEKLSQEQFYQWVKAYFGERTMPNWWNDNQLISEYVQTCYEASLFSKEQISRFVKDEIEEAKQAIERLTKSAKAEVARLQALLG